MRYDLLYQTLANRAVDQSYIDITAFVKRMADAGTSPERINAQLIEDLENDGPIFGKFFRSLGGAGHNTIVAAKNQGSIVGSAIATDEEIAKYVEVNDLADAIDDADPEAMDEIERAVEAEAFTWIAELRATCDRCLPLHGHTYTLAHWNEMGLNPDTIHDGWLEPCHCNLIPQDEAEVMEGDRKEIIGPLVRNKDASGVRGGKSTIRGVTQQDLERARAAVEKAKQTPEGRKTLALLGSSREEEE